MNAMKRVFILLWNVWKIKQLHSFFYFTLLSFSQLNLDHGYISVLLFF